MTETGYIGGIDENARAVEGIAARALEEIADSQESQVEEYHEL